MDVRNYIGYKNEERKETKIESKKEVNTLQKKENKNKKETPDMLCSHADPLGRLLSREG